VLWILFVLFTPLLGAWLGSSLVAFHGGPQELAAAAGVLLFPLLPVAWELRATAQWKKKLQARKQLVGTPKRTFGALDRLILRTLTINLAFLAALVVWFPKTAFSALATRGDWFLGARQDDTSQALRGLVFASARGLEWLHALANPNPYKKAGDDAPIPESVKPTEEKKWARGQGDWTKKTPPRPAPDVPELPTPKPQPPVEAEAAPEPSWTVGATTWPRPNDVHPVVAAMTAADEGSLEAVARTIAARETDPFLRVKALHDWVVTRLHYDKDSLEPGKRKPQDAQSVFANRTGVCEGYARLLVALGAVTGDKIVYVVGDVREPNGAAAAIGHAWNAVEIHGQWYLVDATWDDPIVQNGPQDTYQTDYLFIPPSIAIFDHFPEDPRWQLLNHPLTRGDFLRQPSTGPGFAREGLALISPDRSTVEVNDALELKLGNPRRLHVSVSISNAGSPALTRCGVGDSDPVEFHCGLGAPGKYQAHIFTNKERYGTYGQIASIDVLRR
jgi:hypothetical protein